MIILVRHGEATHHTEHFTGGWTDSNLTDKGRRQIEAAAEKLAKDFSNKMPCFRILCSDLKRAHESAVIFAEIEDLMLSKMLVTVVQAERNFEPIVATWMSA